MKRFFLLTAAILASAVFGPLVGAVVAAWRSGNLAVIVGAGALGGALSGVPVAAPGGILGGALSGAIGGWLIGKLMRAAPVGSGHVRVLIYAGIVYGMMVPWLDPGTLVDWFGMDLENTVLGRSIFIPLSQFGDTLRPIFSPALFILFGMASGGMLMGSFGAFGETLGGDLGGMIGAGLAYTLLGGISGVVVGLISAAILYGILRGPLGGTCAGLVIGVIMGGLDLAFTGLLLRGLTLTLAYVGFGALAGWAVLRRSTQSAVLGSRSD